MVNNRADIVAILLERGADINEAGSDGKTALIRAAWYGHTDVVKILLEKGADVNAKDKKGKTALNYAVEKDHTDIAHQLKVGRAKE